MSDFFAFMEAHTGTLTLLAAAIGWISAFVLAINNLRWRMQNVETHTNENRRLIEKQIDVTRIVELNSVELKAIARASERRLQMIEDRFK